MAQKKSGRHDLIPYGRQTIGAQDVRAVVRALRSDWLTQGPLVPAFEEKLAKICGARYAVAVSSGTAALHLASMAIRLRSGDEVITSPVSFIATSNACWYVGAKAVFADVEPDTANLSVLDAQKKIRKNTRAIYPVHFAGLPADPIAFHRLAKKHRLWLVEDASHALGSEYREGSRWHAIGSCRHSDMAVFSFHPVKTITTGEGGAITTNDRRLYETLLALRSHGVYRSDAMSKNKGPWYYEMRHLGFNYRMTDIQAALGISQLSQLHRFIARRREIASMYERAFSGESALATPKEIPGLRSAFHLYPVRLDFRKIRKSRAWFMSALSQQGVRTQVHYIPIYQQPFYRANGYRRTVCGNAEKFYEKALSLPIYPSMSDAQVRKVIGAVRSLLS